MLQKIEVSLQQLVKLPSVSEDRLQWATAQVNLFFGSFRKADADDPETFTAGCLRLFTAYPPAAVQYVVDPLTGLPGKSEWLPTLRAVKAALDEWEAEQKRAEEALQRHVDADRQITERKAWIESKTKAPSLADLKAKYGPNWGIDGAKEDEEAKAKQRAMIKDAGRQIFEAECGAAGIDPNGGVSPSLIASIKAKSAAA